MTYRLTNALLVTLISIISLLFHVEASQLSEQETLEYISGLSDQEHITPMEIIEIIEPILVRSKDLGWTEVFLEAGTIKMEQYVDIEKISAVEALLNDIIPLANSVGDEVILARLAIVELNILERQGYSPELDRKYRSLLAKAKIIYDRKVIGLIYLAAGRVKSRLADYSEALASLHKAYAIAEELNDLVFLDEVSGELGTVNVRLENYEEGIKYYLKSLAVSIEKNAKYDQSVILYNLGKAYLFNENFIESKEMLDASIRLNIELEDDIGLMWSKRGLADLALAQQQWYRAIDLYNETATFFAEIDDKMSAFRALNGLVEANIAINDTVHAEQALVQSKHLLSTFPTIENTIRYQELLAKVESLKGNFKEAFNVSEIIRSLIKQKYLENKEEEVERRRIQLDSDMKDTENRLLSEKNKLQEFKINQQVKQQQLWYSIIALATILLLVTSYMLYKQTRLRNRFKAMALRDYLTRSPNRRAILEYANQCFKETLESGGTLIIALADLDDFKKLNDTYGHEVGDNVLIGFSKACKKSMRNDDSYGRYGRYGGEEWLIVLPNSSEAIAADILQRVKLNFSSIKVDGIPEDLQVTFSVGVQLFDKDKKEKDVASIISKADTKLYYAKEHGKDQIVF